MTTEQSIERRVVTVLFADLVGFTTLSEALDAEEVAGVQDGYFAAVRETIARYGGKLEKFIGDAAMAVFGVPRVREADAERAVRAGLALVRAVESLSAAVGLEEGALQLRVGVNSGEVAYGSDAEGEWRVSGDAVNVAARLQSAAEPGTVLVGDGTALAVAESIALDAPRELELKGKSESVRAWRAVTPLAQRSRERAMGRLKAPLLGRAAETARLGAALAEARAGGGRAVLVVAPPGVGKTRLVEEVAGAARAEGTPVWRARVVADAAGPAAAVEQLLLAALGVAPAEPVAETLARARAILDGAAGGAADRLHTEAERLLADERSPSAPATARPAPSAPSSLADDRAARFRTWLELLDALAGGRAVVWLLEDLHWASRDLLAFVDYGAAVRPAAGRLILATGRPSVAELLPATGEAVRDEAGSALELLELGPLAGADARALLEALVGPALPAELVETIVLRSDGNPLFVEELLRVWVSLGLLVGEESGWTLRAAPAELALPQTVQQIYAAQLDDLPAEARLLVRRGAVAGRVVPRAGLAALEAPFSDDALAVVGRRAMLTETTPDPIVGRSLSYRHVLLRDAGYASLARAERARLHVHLAEWYEEAAGGRSADVAEQIASHYDAAVANSSRLSSRMTDELDSAAVRRRATAWFERAADGALADAAHELARAHLAAALRHARAADDDPLLRARLLLRLGDVTAYTADMDEGLAMLAEATELYRTAHEESGRTSSAARTGFGTATAAQARAFIQQLQFERAGRLATEALELVGAPDDAVVARLLSIRSWVKSTMTEQPESRDDADRALAIAQQLGDRALELEVLDWRARVLGELGLLRPADVEQIERLAIDLADWTRATRAMRMRAGFLVDDRASEVLPLMDATEAILRRHGTEEELGWLDYTRAEAGFVIGDWPAALAAGHRVMDVAEKSAYHRLAVRTWHVLLPLAEARADRELLARGAAWYSAHEHLFPDSPYGRIVGSAAAIHLARAGLWPPRDHDVEARLPSFATGIGGPSYSSAVETVLEQWLADGRHRAVAEGLAMIDAALAQDPLVTVLGLGAAQHLRARLAESTGSADEAVALARAALDSFRQIAAPWWMHKSLSVLVRAGRASAADRVELAGISARLGI